MTPSRQFRRRIAAALALCTALGTVAACGDDGSIERATSANPGASSESTVESTTSTPTTSSTTSTSTTSTTTEAPAPPTTVSPTTGAPATTTPPTAPPAASPPSTPDDDSADAPLHDLTLELVGTTNECLTLAAPCWYVRTSWLGAPTEFNLVPGAMGAGIESVSSLPVGPAPYPKQDGRYVVQYVMAPNRHDCPKLWATRSTYDPASRGYFIDTLAGPVTACIETPAIAG